MTAPGISGLQRGTPVVALVGNPNTGKTSLFNALTGFRRHVANYPGVTVESARGPLRGAGAPIALLDLPGTYSLAAVSPDEQLVMDALCGRVAGEAAPAAIVAIVDASNLSRNLYLVSQLLELELPLVVAVNMIDIARSRGLEIDCELLSRRLGVPVVPVVATRRATVPPLVQAIERALQDARCETCGSRVELPAVVAEEAKALVAADASLRPVEALRLLLDAPGPMRQHYVIAGGSETRLDAARARLASAGIEGPAQEVRARYAWLSGALQGVIRRPETRSVTWSERLDRLLTHKLGGSLTLLAVLFLVFQSIFRWAGPLMDRIDGAFGWLSMRAADVIPDGALQSLVCDGLIAGVGGVLIFLPQILILFAFIAVLEDCGYLARAAYMMDRLMRTLGLSGRAFIPLLSSFACAVPAIMGTRTIADRRERFVTILIAPFMSCAARLPVYVLMISAFVPAYTYLGGWVELQALVMLAMYLVGLLVAVPIAWLLKKTVFRGPSSGFLLELPSYKWPRLGAVLQRMYFAGRKFVVGAGTVIVAVNLVVWALGYFPHAPSTRAAVGQQAAANNWNEEEVERELAGAYLSDSFLGRAGRFIEPAVRPLGWDWRIGVAVLASFPAREVVVGTMSTIYNLGSEENEESASLRTALAQARWPETVKESTWPPPGSPVFTLPVALSIMVFFALCAQCSSTLVVIGRETGSWRWPVASFVFMTLVAYVAAWATVWAARALWG